MFKLKNRLQYFAIFRKKKLIFDRYRYLLTIYKFKNKLFIVHSAASKTPDVKHIIENT